MQLIFEKSCRGRRGLTLAPLDVPKRELPNSLCREKEANLPELSELDVVRHYTNLSRKNFGLDSHFYPLGSCTMKYNPKVNERLAALQGFTSLHPHSATVPELRCICQGSLKLIHDLEEMLASISGMCAVSLQPLAGAHGELSGSLLIAAYHRDRGKQKSTILVPDSAHGTNPASAAMAGFRVVEIPSAEDGTLDIEAYKKALNDDVAGVMLTCPNTHGLFEPAIHELADLAHEHDALLYYDGANLNAIIGYCRPGDMGFDVMHFNLHKTFGTPHGMGGPGAGPVGVGERLVPYLPNPRVVLQGTRYDLESSPKSIGKVAPFFGNFLVAVRAYAYILAAGREGLEQVARHSVLNANYINVRLKEYYTPAYDGVVMHECIFSASSQAKRGVKALDIAKALLDYGFHAPTVYFPLTVDESIMIEPTETESKDTLDAFCDAMLKIAEHIENDNPCIKNAPQTTPVRRLDEVAAARNLQCACLSD